MEGTKEVSRRELWELYSISIIYNTFTYCRINENMKLVQGQKNLSLFR